MSVSLHRLPPEAGDGVLHVVVESPRGSRVKFEYEPEHRVFKIERPLPAGLAYPFDWGFVPGTEAPDGDPLDAMVMGEQVCYPGTLIEVRLVAVLHVDECPESADAPRANPRLIGVPSWLDEKEAETALDRVRDDIEDFLVRVGEASGDKTIVATRWSSAEAAWRCVREHRRRG